MARQSLDEIKKEISTEDTKFKLLSEKIKSAEDELTAMSETLAQTPDSTSIILDTMNKGSEIIKSINTTLEEWAKTYGTDSPPSLNFTNDLVYSISHNASAISSSNEFSLLKSWAQSNLIAALLILYLTYIITMILFGDFLIDRYNLKEKHTLLARFIKYRGILKNASLVVYITLLYITIIAVIIFNIIPFI